jgi:cytochrome P450
VLSAAQREQGDFVRLAVPGRRPVFLVAAPEHVRHVLQDNHTNYRRTPFHDRLKPVLGEGLVTSEGKLWRHQRRLLQPSFAAARIRSFIPIMAEAALETAEHWQTAAARGAVVDIDAEMSALALRIIARAMFSDPGDQGEVGPAVQTVQEHIAARFWTLVELPDFLPTPGNLRYHRALSSLEAAVARVTARREQENDRPDDLLGRLLAARDPETGSTMSRRQVRDEVMTMFLAGHETSAAGLTWTWYLLAQHPEAVERVRAEAAGAPADRNLPERADLDRLPFTQAVIQEAMRLYPPVPWLARLAAGPDRIGRFEIPAGSLLVVSPYVVQRDPRHWPEPERFDPSRFVPAGSGKRPAYTYFPFGGGPRTCIGNHFAMTEMLVVMAVLAARFRVELTAPGPVQPRALVTLRPAGGFRALVRRCR